MTPEQLVEKYIDAWNDRDLEGLLELMHRGAAYYDAFWMESCVGSDLPRYLEDSMREEPYRYERIGDVITTPTGCVFRYRALSRFASDASESVFQGAEVLTLHDGRIVTVSDFYCIPHEAELREIAGLAANRHGIPKHTESGLSALKVLRVKSRLSDGLEKDRMYLDPEITAAQLAEVLDCTLEQLSAVISREFGTDVDELLDARRVMCAKRQLQISGNDEAAIRQVARHCGFRSYRAFVDKFTDHVGVSPTDYRPRRPDRDAPEHPLPH